MQVLEEGFGTAFPLLHPILCNLSSVYAKQAQLGAAEEAAKRSLVIAEQKVNEKLI